MLSLTRRGWTLLDTPSPNLFTPTPTPMPTLPLAAHIAPTYTSTSPDAPTGKASGQARAPPRPAASPRSSTCPSTRSRPPRPCRTSMRSAPPRAASAGSTSRSGEESFPGTRCAASSDYAMSVRLGGCEMPRARVWCGGSVTDGCARTSGVVTGAPEAARGCGREGVQVLPHRERGGGACLSVSRHMNAAH